MADDATIISVNAAVRDEFLRVCRVNSAITDGVDADMDAAAERFGEFAGFLLAENEKYNLTAIKAPADIAQKHLFDSITPTPYIPRGASLLDIGSGAGFPALPLAVVRPDITALAVDATAKKTAFINAAAERLGLHNLNAVTGRAEELIKSPGMRSGFDVVTARAVSPMRILAELCAPYLSHGGLLIAMKGAPDTAAAEAAEAAPTARAVGLSLARQIDISVYPGDCGKSDISADTRTLRRTLLIYEKTSPTPPCYPRRYSQILKDAGKK